jgi:cytochrome P450
MTIHYDVLDEARVERYRAALAGMRADEPVAEVAPGVFYVSRYDDVVEVCRQPDLFRQARFIRVGADERTEDQLHLGEMNPPLHTRVRRVLSSVLSPSNVRPFETFVRQTCAELVDAFASRGTADLIAELGTPLPGIVIGQLTGTPDDLRPYLHEYPHDLMAIQHDPASEEGRAARARMDAYNTRVLALVHDRRGMADPPRDLITALVQARDDDGNALSDDKILVHLGGDLLVGGTHTTRHLVGNLFFELLQTPGAYERVRDDRALVPTVVEEALRIRAPVQMLFREPVRDVDLAGVRIPAGSTVVIGYGSANLDGAAFPDAERFDVDRGDAVKRHLGFGWGIHHCVGAPLARLEVACALDAVLDRIAHMHLAPGSGYDMEPARAYDHRGNQLVMMLGPTRLDVVFDPAR